MYKALYRKYRPKDFSDVIGQDHITHTLMNEINTGRHSHAYLFCGTRGTGKTTCAKIFAKAVNCLNPVNGDPCNECENCRGIDNGSILDVIEIDAASNNGVDNIRDLRQEANFSPVNSKYRVYIIDEVHMLSPGAFNALLKTLEEPPEYVKFILATTEVNKLPATILSRCQRFDFKRISSEDISKRLLDVSSKESINLSDDASILIARLADGAMRDALSILDQCVNTQNDVTVEVVNNTVGLADKSYLFDLSECISEKDSSRALSVVAELHNKSCDMERLETELINHFRNLMITKTAKNPENLIVCTDYELSQYREYSKKFELFEILSILDIISQSLQNIKRGIMPRIEIEMTLIKLCKSEGNVKVPAPEIKKAPIEKKPEKPAFVAPEISEEVPDKNEKEEFSWKNAIANIEKKDRALTGLLSLSKINIDGNKAYITSDNSVLLSLVEIQMHKDAITNELSRMLGEQIKVIFGEDRKEKEEKEEIKQEPMDLFNDFANKNESFDFFTEE